LEGGGCGIAEMATFRRLGRLDEKRLGIVKVGSPSRALRKEGWLDETSSVGAYEDPRITGVPFRENRGEPILQEGIATSRIGGPAVSISSIVLGLGSSAGFEITTLKAPSPISLTTLVSRTVESERARRLLGWG